MAPCRPDPAPPAPCAHTAYGRCAEEDASLAFDTLDADGGGTIAIQEFMAVMRAVEKQTGITASPPPEPAPAPAGPAEEEGAAPIDWVGKPQRVELTMSCVNLPSGARGAMLPIFAVLWMWRKEERRWQEHGRTEVVRDQEPTFVTSFFLDYIDHNDNYTGEHDQVTRPPPTALSLAAWPLPLPCCGRPGSALSCCCLVRCVQWAKVGIFVRKSQLADLSRHEEFGEAIFTLRDIYRVPVRRIARKMIKGGEVNICMGALPPSGRALAPGLGLTLLCRPPFPSGNSLVVD